MGNMNAIEKTICETFLKDGKLTIQKDLIKPIITAIPYSENMLAKEKTKPILEKIIKVVKMSNSGISGIISPIEGYFPIDSVCEQIEKQNITKYQFEEYKKVVLELIDKVPSEISCSNIDELQKMIIGYGKKLSFGKSKKHNKKRHSKKRHLKRHSKKHSKKRHSRKHNRKSKK